MMNYSELSILLQGHRSGNGPADSRGFCCVSAGPVSFCAGFPVILPAWRYMN